jgi:hypothetical protein
MATDILKKLRFKGNAVVLHAPASLERQFAAAGFRTSLDKKEQSQNTLVFVNNHREFTGFLDKQLKYIEPDGVLWFAYPKGSSGIKTDINRDILWQTAKDYGIRPVSAIAIDDTWSGLRFRPFDQVGK